MKTIFALICAAFLIINPNRSSAAVKINEIAWMGNEKSSYGEWVELFNDGSSEIDLNGAKLFEEGGKTLVINLTKKIGAGAYFLIERVTPSVPDPVLGLEDDAGSFGGSGFSNSGEYLVLKSADGTILDSVDALSGWPAGDSTTKQTMQWSGTAWITATATPKAKNASTVSNTTTTDNNASTTLTTETSSTPNYSYSSHSNSSEISTQNKKIKAFLSAGRDRVVLIGTPVQFFAKFTDEDGSILYGDNYKWSFGDAGYSQGDKTAHVYDIEGEYVVVLSATFGGQEYTSRANIRAVNPDIKLDAIINKSGDYVIYITNNSINEINLKGWQMRTRRRFLILENDIILMPKKTVPLSSKYTNMDLWAEEEFEFVYPTGKVYSVTKTRKDADSATEVAEMPKNVDKGVDNPVDKVGKEVWTKELSSLENQLKTLQNSLVANVSDSKRAPINLAPEKRIINNDIAVEKVATTTADSEKIVLLPQKRESSLWRFLKGIFSHK